MAAAVGLVVVPLVELLAETAEAGAALDAGTGGAVGGSLLVSTAATLVAVVVGTAGALITERGPRPAVLRVAFVVPLVVPPFVSAVAAARAFGPGGLTDDLVGIAVPGLVGPVGIVLVMAVHAAPLVYLLVAASLATRARPEFEAAGLASGASPRRVLGRITLPLLGPAVVGGGALAFAVSMNSFGIPAVLGIPAGFPTITTRIYGDLARSASDEAFGRVLLLSVALVGIVLVAVVAAERMGRRATAVVPGAAAREPLPRTPPGRRGRGFLWVYLGVTTGVPLLALLATALTRAVGLAPWPGNWTLANFSEAWSGPAWPAATRSLALAALAASVLSVFGLAAAVGARRSRWSGPVTAATFAVPGSALAVAVLLAYGPWLRDTLLLVLIAYLAKFWALAHRSIDGSAASLEQEAVRAARAAGAGRWRTLRRIVLPSLLPAAAAGWLLVFLFGIHELTMSSLLYGPGTETLAVHTLNVQQLGDVTVTSALAVLLTVPGLVAAVVVARRHRRAS